MSIITNPKTIARRKAVAKFAAQHGLSVGVAAIQFRNLRKSTQRRKIKAEKEQ